MDLAEKIEALAKSGRPIVNLPHPVKTKYDVFSFSGLKTTVKLVCDSSDNHSDADIAASFQSRVAEILAHKLEYALDVGNYKQLVLCGGVFANQTIRSVLSESLSVQNIAIPSLALCTDNAGMIGLAAEVYLKYTGFQDLIFECTPQLGLRYPIRL